MELEDFLEKCFSNWKRVLKFSIYFIIGIIILIIVVKNVYSVSEQ